MARFITKWLAWLLLSDALSFLPSNNFRSSAARAFSFAPSATHVPRLCMKINQRHKACSFPSGSGAYVGLRRSIHHEAKIIEYSSSSTKGSSSMHHGLLLQMSTSGGDGQAEAWAVPTNIWCLTEADDPPGSNVINMCREFIQARRKGDEARQLAEALGEASVCLEFPGEEKGVRCFHLPGAKVTTVRETTFGDGGLGYSVWDAGIAMSTWISLNSKDFAGRRVLELGAGVGVTGLTCAHSGASHVVLSDFGQPSDESSSDAEDGITGAGITGAGITGAEPPGDLNPVPTATDTDGGQNNVVAKELQPRQLLSNLQYNIRENALEERCTTMRLDWHERNAKADAFEAVIGTWMPRHIHTQTHMHTKRARTHTHTAYIYSCTICTHKHCRRTHTCAICACTHTSTNTHKHTQTNIHTITHTHTQNKKNHKHKHTHTEQTHIHIHTHAAGSDIIYYEEDAEALVQTILERTQPGGMFVSNTPLRIHMNMACF
jgi:predicted nicotinamide N-methyase